MSSFAKEPPIVCKALQKRSCILGLITKKHAKNLFLFFWVFSRGEERREKGKGGGPGGGGERGDCMSGI